MGPNGQCRPPKFTVGLEARFGIHRHVKEASSSHLPARHTGLRRWVIGVNHTPGVTVVAAPKLGPRQWPRDEGES